MRRDAGGAVEALETTRGLIRTRKVGVVAAGNSSVVMRMAGIRLPLESFPLQALVSEPVKPVFPCVVMSNAIHAYISQSDKGELVIGAGTDAYTSYTQRGALHVDMHTLEAICELFPCFRRLRMLRNWGGIVDVTPDRSPIIGKTPVPGLFVNCGWGTGGFKATPGSAHVFAWTMAKGEPHPIAAPFSLERFRDGAADRRGRRRRRRALTMLLIHCPYCGERPGDRVLLRRPGAPRAAGAPGGTLRRRMGGLPVPARQPARPARRALAPRARLRALLQCAARHDDRPLRRHLQDRGERAVSAFRTAKRRTHRPRAHAAVHASTARPTRASPATRWPRRCSRTACTSSGARSSTTGRAASSRPAPRSRTRS